MAVEQLSKGNDAGTTFGLSASDLISFYNETPVVQAAAITAPVDTAATSTTPFGYTEAQANALITSVRSILTALQNVGIIA